MSLTEPVRLLAQFRATSRVLGPSRDSRSSGSIFEVSRLNGSHLMERSRSSASSSQGETFPSWSMRVTMISSPGASRLPTDRDRCRVRLVMLCATTISSGECAFTNSAMARCAPA